MGQVVGNQPALPGRLQPAAVNEWRAPDVPDEPRRLAYQVLAVSGPQVQVSPPEAERVDLPIQLFQQLFGAADVAVRADPFDDHTLAQDLGLEPMIPTAAPKADRHHSFREHSVLCQRLRLRRSDSCPLRWRRELCPRAK